MGKQDMKSRLQLRKRKTIASFMNKGSRLDSLASLADTISRPDESSPIKIFEKKSESFGIPQRSMENTTGDDSFGVKFHDNIYGTGCPPNPYRPTLRYLFNSWITLSRLHNINSFLCAGSLIGLVRNGDIIPYDRDIDVCMSHKEFYKVQKLSSPKPFNYQDGRVHVAIQDDFFTKDMEKRTRVDCRGRRVTEKTDPCAFTAPGARLIAHGLFLDVFIFQENGRYMIDMEYKAMHLTKDIFPLKPCVFMGIETKCPHNQTALFLRYYDPRVVKKPHFVCRNKTWIPTTSTSKRLVSPRHIDELMREAKRQAKIKLLFKRR